VDAATIVSFFLGILYLLLCHFVRVLATFMLSRRKTKFRIARDFLILYHRLQIYIASITKKKILFLDTQMRKRVGTQAGMSPNTASFPDWTRCFKFSAFIVSFPRYMRCFFSTKSRADDITLAKSKNILFRKSMSFFLCQIYSMNNFNINYSTY